MTPNEIKALSVSIANMLISHAAHGVATGSLVGTGEHTLRDGLVVAAAAEGARMRQAWIIEREIVPPSWEDQSVDLVIRKKGNRDKTHVIGGAELKWWRKIDAANSANRRQDLIRDFIRAAALYPLVQDFSFVALLSTAGSWSATTSTTGSDKHAMTNLSSSGQQNWNLQKMITSKAVEGGMRSLRDKMDMPNVFHTELLTTITLNDEAGQVAFAKVWAVKKPQNTKFLSSKELDKLIPKKVENPPPNPMGAVVQPGS